MGSETTLKMSAYNTFKWDNGLTNEKGNIGSQSELYLSMTIGSGTAATIAVKLS